MTTTTTVTCPHCGAPNEPVAAFCASCGKALPTATPAAPRLVTGSAVASTAAGAHLQADQLLATTKKAAGALLLVAILQTFMGPVALLIAKQQMEAQTHQVMVIKPIGYAIVWGIAACFFALYIWARKSPFPAAVVGLVLFISIHVLDVIADPTSLARGIILKIIVIAILVRAIKAGQQHRKLLATGSPA